MNGALPVTGERVLLVDDIEDVRLSMGMVLVKAGFLVDYAADGGEAVRKVYSSKPDLVLLDIMMPVMDGFTACKQIRDISDVPIIMLTAIGTETEKIRALNTGADSYIVKGTGMDEILARVSSALRRARAPAVNPPAETYSDSVVEIDFKRQRVDVRGERVELTPKEFGILATLVQRDGRPVTSRALLCKLWGTGDDPVLVKCHVKSLRGKIEADPERPELIVTRRGFGYVYATPTA